MNSPRKSWKLVLLQRAILHLGTKNSYLSLVHQCLCFCDVLAVNGFEKLYLISENKRIYFKYHF